MSSKATSYGGFTQTTRIGGLIPVAPGAIYTGDAHTELLKQIERMVPGYYGWCVGDHFLGTGGLTWLTTITSSGTVAVQTGNVNGECLMASGTTSGGAALLTWNGYMPIKAASGPIVEWGIKHGASQDTQVTYVVGLYDGTENNRIDFVMTAAGAAVNWSARTTSGGTTTTTDTGVAFGGTTYKHFRLEVTTTSVSFYIRPDAGDDVLVATHLLNIPTANLQPRIYVTTTNTTTKTMTIDYFGLLQAVNT